VRLDDEAVLEDISAAEPAKLPTLLLTGTQQAVILGLWWVGVSVCLCFFTIFQRLTMQAGVRSEFRVLMEWVRP